MVTFPVISLTSILYVGALMAPAVATYEPRDPSSAVLYKVIAEHLETFLASLHDDPDAKGLPDYVQREFYDYLQCGILARGFLRLGCESCKQEILLAFSCKRKGLLEFLSANATGYKTPNARLQARRGAVPRHACPQPTALLGVACNSP